MFSFSATPHVPLPPLTNIYKYMYMLCAPFFFLSFQHVTIVQKNPIVISSTTTSITIVVVTAVDSSSSPSDRGVCPEHLSCQRRRPGRAIDER